LSALLELTCLEGGEQEQVGSTGILRQQVPVELVAVDFGLAAAQLLQELRELVESIVSGFDARGLHRHGGERR